jgi:hypothetical protein
MNKHAKKLERELNNCGRMPIFEIEVIRNDNGQKDWVLCDVFVRRNSIVAQRDAVSKREERSKFIAQTCLAIDSAFGLDDHLQDLYSAVMQSIVDGDLYDLPTN